MKKIIYLIFFLFISLPIFAFEPALVFSGVPPSTPPAGEFCDSDTADECEDWDAGASPNNKRYSTYTIDTDSDASGTIVTDATPSAYACDGSYNIDITHDDDTAGDCMIIKQLAAAWSSADTDYWIAFDFILDTAGALADQSVGTGINIGGLDSAQEVANPYPLGWSLYKTGTGTYEIRFLYYDSGGSLSTLDFNMAVAVGTKYSFKARWKRVTSANDQIEIYFNGTSQNSGGDIGEEIHSTNPAYWILGSTGVAAANFNLSYRYDNIQIDSGASPGACTE